jgi:hypothetical protein
MFLTKHLLLLCGLLFLFPTFASSETNIEEPADSISNSQTPSLNIFISNGVSIVVVEGTKISNLDSSLYKVIPASRGKKKDSISDTKVSLISKNSNKVGKKQSNIGNSTPKTVVKQKTNEFSLRFKSSKRRINSFGFEFSIVHIVNVSPTKQLVCLEHEKIIIQIIGHGRKKEHFQFFDFQKHSDFVGFRIGRSPPIFG